jgi:hypothetical protein
MHDLWYIRDWMELDDVFRARTASGGTSSSTLLDFASLLTAFIRFSKKTLKR